MIFVTFREERGWVEYFSPIERHVLGFMDVFCVYRPLRASPGAEDCTLNGAEFLPGSQKRYEGR